MAVEVIAIAATIGERGRRRQQSQNDADGTENDGHDRRADVCDEPDVHCLTLSQTEVPGAGALAPVEYERDGVRGYSVGSGRRQLIGRRNSSGKRDRHSEAK